MVLTNENQSINDKEAHQMNGGVITSLKLGDQALNHSPASQVVINGVLVVKCA